MEKQNKTTVRAYVRLGPGCTGEHVITVTAEVNVPAEAQITVELHQSLSDFLTHSVVQLIDKIAQLSTSIQVLT